MKKILILILILRASAYAQVSVPFTSDQWTFANEGHSLETFQGKACLTLKQNRAMLKGLNFENGILEYDVAFPHERDFIGIHFRTENDDNYEEFYLRPHQSGNPDANQYSPVYGTLSGWQLYYGEGHGVAIEYPYNEWIHVKLAIAGKYMDVYINDMDKPVLFCELKRSTRQGSVSFQDALGEAHFANFTYTAIDQEKVTLKGSPKPAAAAAEGTCLTWDVSSSFPEKNLEKITSLKSTDKAGLTWTTGQAENTGTVNLAMYNSYTQEKNTVFCRVVVESDRDQVKKFLFGFSDRVRFFFNDNLVFSGDDSFQTRDYRFLGTIGYFDAVYLPLKKGKNEIILAVSENFGGWGVRGRFEDVSGIKIGTSKK